MLESISIPEKIHISSLKVSPFFTQSSLHSDGVIPKSIMKKMSSDTYFTHKFHIETLSGRSIDVFLTLSNKDWHKVHMYSKVIYLWFCFADKFNNDSRHCSKRLSVYILYAPDKKKLPKIRYQTLDVIHCNTAFTYSCITSNEIVIFRQEEWFKVLIHETIHAFGLDFGHTQFSDIQNLFSGLVHCDNVRSNEAFTETWAIMIHCVFKAFLEKKEIKTIDEYIQIEQRWSIQQCNKVLYHYGITYKGLIHGTDKFHYHESHSSPFSYYILKCVLLIHADEFQTSFRFGLLPKCSTFFTFIKKRFNTAFLHDALLWHRMDSTTTLRLGNLSTPEFE